MSERPPLLQAGIGVVVPYDFALDRELWRWVPDDMSLHLTRMNYVPLAATIEMAHHISEAALVAHSATDVLPVSPLVTAYACTFGSYIGGLVGESALVNAMETVGCRRAVTTSGALVSALRHLEITRIATVAPYTEDLTEGLTAFLAEADVKVVATGSLGLTSKIWQVPYGVTAELVHITDTPDAQAVFVSCTNLPTYDAIASLEADLGKPVLTANQVTMWAALTLAGRKAVGPGQRLVES